MLSKKRSSIWNHFTLVDQKYAKCSNCSNKISYGGGSSGNLLRHMKTKHITVPLDRTGRHNSNTMTEHIEEHNIDEPSTLGMPASNTSTQILTSVTPTNIRPVQSSITSYVQKPVSISKSKKIDSQIAKLIIKHYHPFSLVEEKEFKNLIQMLAPGYVLPSRKTVSNSLLPQLYESTVDTIKNKLKNVTAVCLTTDAWTSINNESYVAVTAHYIDDDTKMSSILIGCQHFTARHTAVEMSSLLIEQVNKWGLVNKITMIVSDNAANMVAAVRLCQWRHFPCFAHSINLIVQSGLEEMKSILNKVKAIVEYFKRSTYALSRLNEIQTRGGYSVLKLKQDCPTRWNSTYDMVDRILKIKEPVLSTLAIINNDLNTITFDEWNVLKVLCQLLKIFYDVTNEISSENYVSISKVTIFSRAMVSYVSGYINNITMPTEICSVEKF